MKNTFQGYKPANNMPVSISQRLQKLANEFVRNTPINELNKILSILKTQYNINHTGIATILAATKPEHRKGLLAKLQGKTKTKSKNKKTNFQKLYKRRKRSNG